MTGTALLSISRLVKRFGGIVASDSVDLEVRPDEIHAVIGPNGAGKTTLVAQIFGELRPDAGRIRFGGQDIDGLAVSRRVALGVGRTFQITQLLTDETAETNVALAIQARRGHSFRFLRDARGETADRAAARAELAAAGLADRARVPVADLSHGEQKQVELAIALAARPRLLLLDEPMAGLGPVESAAMIERLRGLKGRIAMLLIEHDMDAVFALADRITVLVHGRVIASAPPAEIRDDAAVRAAYLGEGDA